MAARRVGKEGRTLEMFRRIVHRVVGMPFVPADQMEAGMMRYASARRFRLDQKVVILPLAVVLIVAAVGMFRSGVAAQAPETIDFRIVKVNCEEDPGSDIPISEGGVPEGCEAAEGVRFTVSDTEGNEIASCTTDAEGRCTVQAPNEADVVVEEDESTGEAGFSPLVNPIETTAVTEFAGAEFINVRDAKPELPDTGTGDGAVILATGMTGLIAVVATLLALGGALVRRPGER